MRICADSAEYMGHSKDLMVLEGMVVVYLDDILIFTKDLDEHRQITHRVLGRPAEYQLYLRPEKCEFEKTQIEYLGLIIFKN